MIEHTDDTEGLLLPKTDLVAFTTDAQWAKYAFPKKKAANQYWVGFGWESSLHWPFVRDLNNTFLDLTVGYHPEYFDIHATHTPSDIATFWTTIVETNKTAAAPAIRYVATCGCNGTKSGRDAVVLELMRYMRVDSWGAW